MNLFQKIRSIFNKDTPDDEFWSELETALIEADVGVDLTGRLIESVRKLKTMSEIRTALAGKIEEIFQIPTEDRTTRHEDQKFVPRVFLILGVNGVGKTTTIAKLAHGFKGEGKKVLLVAADTFRAAAVDQLKIWGERLKLEVVAQGEGADSAAVAFDGVKKGIAKGFDVVIIDTAGRLHTKQNLMEELKKVARVVGKALPGAPHERWLVLDATVGSNGLLQARQFNQDLGLTGVIVAKLDGTAKGGIVISVADELKIPIVYIGLGEGMGDLKIFDPRLFSTFIVPFI